MISDEPDEDADELDDEKALEAYLGINSGAGPEVVVDLPDWPPGCSQGQAVGLHLDMSTVAWFKAHYVDWQREIGSVLRGWIVAHTRDSHDGQTSG
jgi:hypothetical protein